MNSKQAILWGGVLLAGLLIYTFAVYPALPDRLPIHWNIRGEVDGWADKRTAVCIMPGVMLMLLAMIPTLPTMSPRSYKMEPFLPTYNYLMLVVNGLMGYIHIIMLQAGLNPHLDFGKVLMVGLYLSFALMGNVLGKTRRNFFMGIRTPWTLASDKVWIATHRLGGRVFVVAGIIGALSVALGVPPQYGFVIIIAMAFVPVIYSYFLFKQLDSGTP